MKCYLVGGAVRDRLLGRPNEERDYVVVGSSPQEMEAQGFKAVGKDFPVFLHPESKMEYALARTERKTAPGYKGFVFHFSSDVSLEQDLQRRDLTVNAMAEDEDGRLIDPCGGQEDLQARCLRHVSPAFVEDPLRVLRVARFAAQLDFSVAPETVKLMRELADSGELSHLVPERVWRETCKALCSPSPSRYVSVLRECGALAELFPEIDRLFGIPQTEKWHPEVDTGVHTLLVLEQSALLSEDPQIRFAALVHDLGKAATPPEEWPSHKMHDVRGVPIIRDLCRRLRAPKQYQELAEMVSRFHIKCHHALEMNADTVVKFLGKELDAFRRPERFRKFLLCCTADVRGRKGMQDVPHPQAEFLEDAYQACLKADTESLRERGLQGQKFARALDQERTRLVRDLARA